MGKTYLIIINKHESRDLHLLIASKQDRDRSDACRGRGPTRVLSPISTLCNTVNTVLVMDPLDVYPTPRRPSNVFSVSLDHLDYLQPRSHDRGSSHQLSNAVHPGLAVVFIPLEVVRSGEDLVSLL